MTPAAVRCTKLAVGLAAAAGFAWLLLNGLDAAAFGAALDRLSASSLVAALAFMSAAHGVRIVRWWCTLRTLEPELPLASCIRPFLAGMALNNVLPLRAGDALRTVGFRRQLRSPAMRILGTLAIERALDVLFLAAILFICLLSLPEGKLPQAFITAAVWMTAVALLGLLACALFPPHARHLLERACAGIGRFPRAKGRGWPQAAARHGTNFLGALGVVRSAWTMLSLVSLSGVIWACEGMAFVVLAADLHLAAGAPMAPWLSLAAGSLATAVPSAPGFVGTFDYFAALGFTVWGASPESAAALAITIHALWLPPTAVGLLCYWLPPPAKFKGLIGRVALIANRMKRQALFPKSKQTF